MSPLDLLHRGALLLAPPAYLLTDVLYAARGWDDAGAGGVHVLAALAYGFVLLALAARARGWWAVAMTVTAVLGTAGNVAYGFNTIEVSLGAVDLVDSSGPGALIKPLGLFFPLALLMGAAVLARTGHRASAAAVAVAGLAWPVAHIANLGWLAVAVNAVLVLALVPLAVERGSADGDVQDVRGLGRERREPHAHLA